MKAIKLFCEMSDIPVSWKKISRGLPKTRTDADNRAPTIKRSGKSLNIQTEESKAYRTQWLPLELDSEHGTIFVGNTLNLSKEMEKLYCEDCCLPRR